MKLLLLICAVFLSYSTASQPIWITHRADFLRLERQLSCCWKKEELHALFQSPDAVLLDAKTMRNLRFILTPRSQAKQKRQHINFIPRLVNDKTIAAGLRFFIRYQDILRMAYNRYGVCPQDIIAVLNWESKLGAIVGDQPLVKIFVGQYFFGREIEKQLFAEGVYNKKDAMPRSKALRRIDRLKQRALRNLVALLKEAKRRGFDPLSVKGSWAGAIGFPQFMPSSMGFAADGDGDGKIDLSVMEDAIMSVASFLSAHRYKEKGYRYSFRRYNPEDMYVKGVTMYRNMAEKAGISAKEWKKTQNKSQNGSDNK